MKELIAKLQGEINRQETIIENQEKSARDGLKDIKKDVEEILIRADNTLTLISLIDDIVWAIAGEADNITSYCEQMKSAVQICQNLKNTIKQLEEIERD